MKTLSTQPKMLALIAMLALPASASVLAQTHEQPEYQMTATVTGTPPADLTGMPEGPDVEGFISARTADRMQVRTKEGANTLVAISESTQIRSRSGLFGSGRGRLTADSLLNGLPVTVKTVQWGNVLVARQVRFKGNDFRTASMIRNGTDQRFNEQAAATEALRGRMADIDKYNIRSTTNVNFATGQWTLSDQAKTDLCNMATEAQSTENALLLVVGYTDSVGSEEYNQILSERRASRVVNYLQQACGWKPYRMLTPTGMAESDPMASNDTWEGKAQNRRVSVNVLVSKALDGM